MKTRSGPPSSEEFQRQLQDLMRRHFQSGPTIFAKAASNQPQSEEPPQSSDEAFDFEHKPREVKAYLDRFVIKQDEAKKVLSVALCDHYHHVRLAFGGKEQPNYAQQNVILLGPTGVGKKNFFAALPD